MSNVIGRIPFATVRGEVISADLVQCACGEIYIDYDPHSEVPMSPAERAHRARCTKEGE